MSSEISSNATHTCNNVIWSWSFLQIQVEARLCCRYNRYATTKQQIQCWSLLLISVLVQSWFHANPAIFRTLLLMPQLSSSMTQDNTNNNNNNNNNNNTSTTYTCTFWKVLPLEYRDVDCRWKDVSSHTHWNRLSLYQCPTSLRISPSIVLSSRIITNCPLCCQNIQSLPKVPTDTLMTHPEGWTVDYLCKYQRLLIWDLLSFGCLMSLQWCCFYCLFVLL